MTYEAQELSVDSARPVELYQFNYTGNFWYYTSADREIVANGITYKPIPMIRSEIPSAVNMDKAGITVTLPRDATICDIFRVSPPSEPVIFTIYAEHYLDGSIQVAAKGRVINCEWLDNNEVQLTCESIFSSLQRNGLRRRITPQCVFQLYGDDCGVLASEWRVDTILTGLSGLIMTVSTEASKPDGWYAGGKVTWVNGNTGNTERRMIRFSHEGFLTLSSIPMGLAAGTHISLYAGCDHTLDGVNGCVLKFNNAPRYGGTPYMPVKKPFSGSSLF